MRFLLSPRASRTGLIAAAILLGVAKASHADLTTVVWAPDGSNDGVGTGLLGTTTVTYSSAVGFNSGTTLTGQNWAAFTGTNGATNGPVSSQTAGVLGGDGVGTVQTIQFSAATANPILLVNFLDQSDVFNFGANGFTVLDSNNVTVTPPILIGSGSAADAQNDGFAVQFTGTFGPGTPLVFNFSSNGAGTNGLQTVGFTIGLAQTVNGPEPGTLALLALGTLAGSIVLRRRKA